MRWLFNGAAIASLIWLALLSAPATALTPVPVSGTVYFEKDSAELSEASRKMLIGIASYIRYGRSTCINVRVSGHLDRAEAKAGNRRNVDLKRATNVRDFLGGLEILADNAFDVFTYGSERPELANASDDEPKNRRVQINWECAKAR